MVSKKEAEKIIDDFKKYFPIIDKHAKTYEVKPHGLMIVKMDDDDILLFNQNDKSIRTFKEGYSSPLYDVDEEIMKIYFSSKLNSLLELKNMNRKDLADITGISSTSICQYTAGISTPNLFNARKIANALGVSVNDLIDF